MSKTKKIITKNTPISRKKQLVTFNKVANNIATLEKSERLNSKQDILITLMKRPLGATLNEMVLATNWQKHSVRGVISGGLKKRLKLPIVSELEDRGRVYRICGER